MVLFLDILLGVRSSKEISKATNATSTGADENLVCISLGRLEEEGVRRVGDSADIRPARSILLAVESLLAHSMAASLVVRFVKLIY